MSKKSFFYLFITIILVGILSVAVCNYYLNYYYVFSPVDTKYFKLGMANERFLKMRYLLADDHYEKYRNYILGSSRVLKMDPNIIDKETYNLGVSGGMTEDYVMQIRSLLQNGAKIDNIYLGLDDFSCWRSYEGIIKGINWLPYPVSVKEVIDFYNNYLFNIQIIKNGKFTIEEGNLVIKSGEYILDDEIEQEIETFPQRYVMASKFREVSPAIVNVEDDREFQRCIQNLREIDQLCKENHINLTVFFNPIHAYSYLNEDIVRLNRFKKEIVQITPFYDFSGINYVTINNYFWYETTHPRAFICDKILDIVSGQNQITWVPDFGVYVTEENVDAFCEKAVRDREAYDPNHEQWVPSAEERAVMTKRVNYPW